MIVLAKRDIRRKPGSTSSKDRIVVLVEGELTEVCYFEGIRDRWRLPKDLITIEKSSYTDAKSVVREAVERKEENARSAKRGRELLVDQWWAVVDTEGELHNLNDAIQKARANGIRLAISDLSIEYWLLLHFRYTTAFYNSVDDLIRDLGVPGCLPGYTPRSKKPDMDILYPRLSDAVQRARRVRENYTKSGFYQPCTDCDLLVDAMAEQADKAYLNYESHPVDYSDLLMYAL